MQQKLNLKKNFLILVSSVFLFSCTDYPDVHPTILDFQLNEARVYKIVDKANVTFEFEKVIPLVKTDGYVCLSQSDYVALREYYKEKSQSKH